MKTFAALEIPEYRRFWISQWFSLIGSWLQSSAQSWLVLGLFADRSAATVQLGVLNAIQWLPSLVLSLFAGAVLDRFSRKHVLIVTQVILMLMAVTMGLVVYLKIASFQIVAIIAFISGLANVFDIIARQSLIPQLVPKHLMSNAVALGSLSFNTARVLGGTIFGLLAPIFGLHAIFWLNALSFVGVIIVISSLKTRAGEDSGQHRMLEDIRIGLGYVWSNRAVRDPIVLLGLLSLTVINFPVITPTYAKFALNLKETGFGLLGSAFGIGAALGAVFTASRPPEARVRLMGLGAVLLCIGVGSLYFTPNLELAALGIGIAGMGMISFTVSANSTVQLSTPDFLRARVMSVYTLVFAGFAPPGALFVGALFARFGTRTGVLILAILGLICVALIRPKVQPHLERVTKAS